MPSPAHTSVQSRLVTMATGRSPIVAVVAAPPAPPKQQTQAPEPALPVRERLPVPAGGSGGDPWSDPRWVGVKWTVYRDVVSRMAGMCKRPAGGQARGLIGNGS